MLAELKAGLRRIANSAVEALRGTSEGALVVAHGAPSECEEALQGDVFLGADLAGTAVTTQAGLSATTPALTLYNPVGSGVIGVLKRVTIGITASPAAAVVFSLAYNLANAAAPTLTTLAQVSNAKLDSKKLPTLQCARVATLAAAPLAIRYLEGGSMGASAISAGPVTTEIDGGILIPPGVAVSIQSTAAAAILASFEWSEKPV